MNVIQHGSAIYDNNHVQPLWGCILLRGRAKRRALYVTQSLSALPSALSHNYVRGSITIYIINLHRSRKKIKLAGTLRNNTVHQYLLQPFGADGLRARSALRSVTAALTR